MLATNEARIVGEEGREAGRQTQKRPHGGVGKGCVRDSKVFALS